MEMINRTTAIITGIIGVLLGVAGLFVYLTWPDQVWIYTTLEVLAAVHLTVFFLTYFEVIKAVSQQRSTRFGANSVLMVILFVAILSILNFIVSQHEARIDLSSAGEFTLSPQTVEVLKGLKQEVKLSGFFAEGSAKAGPAEDLIGNYRHQSAKVKYERIDPDKKPAVAKQYGVTEYDTVVLETKGQSATVTNVSEQTLTSALIRLSRETKKQFYFIEGHGEHSIDNADRGGYSYLKEALASQGFSVLKLMLLSEKEVPKDAAVVVIGGPQSQYTPEEKTALDNYLSAGGQLFVMLDPMIESGLEDLLLKWGVVLEKDLIIDPSSGLGPAVPVVSPNGYLPHDITQKFNMATFYSLARSVAFDPEKAEQIRFDSIIQTGPNSWATKELGREISIDPSRDKKGPIVLGGVFTLKRDGGGEQATDTASAMRLVVVGDSDFATNAIVRAAGNGDLFQNMVSWLAKERDLISIRPKEAKVGTLLLSNPQQKMLFYTSVVILPFSTLVIGLFISRKRRRL